MQIFLFLKIYLKGRVTNGVTARAWPGLCSSLVSPLESVLGFLSQALIGSWIGSGTARIRTGAHVGCRHRRQWLDSLRHDASLTNIFDL